MPTMLDFCNIKSKDSHNFHGKSIKALLTGSSPMEDRIIVTDSQRLTRPVKWRKSAVMSHNWRLVNGKELYDVEKDREQRHNIAHQHPHLVETLRLAYEEWWELVSLKFEEDIPIVLGQEAVHITTHDIRNEECETAWHQGHVRQGLHVHGHYEIEVESKGRYEIQLRRWPASEAIPLSKAIEGTDIAFRKEVISEKNWHLYSGSLALPLAYGHLEIQGFNDTKAIREDQDTVSFTLDLEVGKTMLQAWFSDHENHVVTAAYFVDIRKIA
jgi:hypothetical protein